MRRSSFTSCLPIDVFILGNTQWPCGVSLTFLCRLGVKKSLFSYRDSRHVHLVSISGKFEMDKRLLTLVPLVKEHKDLF